MNKDTSKIHLDILDEYRQNTFDRLSVFNDSFILSGGTALGLQIRHRKSFDFDLFSEKPLKAKLLFKIRETFGAQNIRLFLDADDQLDVTVAEKVKISFVHFPFPHLYPPVKTNSISLFSVLDLASSKAYTIGRRPVWRDYVDLFFALKKGFALEIIIKEANQRFKGMFDEKLFLEQLVYYADIQDFYIEYLDYKPPTDEIKDFFKVKVEEYLARILDK